VAGNALRMTDGRLGFERNRVDELLAALEAMAGGDIRRQAPISERRDELDAIAHGVNVMAGELHFRLQELQRTQGHLVQSGKLAALGEVSSGLAHELNNPLAIMRGYVERAQELLREPSAPREEVERCLERIDANVDRMDSIIRHIMEFSRQTRQERRRVDLREVVRKAFIMLNEQLRLLNIRVVEDFEAGPLEVWGDELRLEQVLINLLTNARDAIGEAHGEHGGTIRLSARAASPAEMELSVADDGVGITEEVRSHLFTPFFTTKGVGKGTGLGLSISLGIIQEHQGTISCGSEAGRGAVFTLRLPRWEEG
jgi:C4-dicarboxylate-specific signal transduction histidine kinase